MKHTPGPWSALGPAIDQITANNGKTLIAKTWYGPTAPDGEGEVMANANLIAAAPDLLAALRIARAYMNTKGEQSRLDVAQVDAALAKVRV